MFHDTPPCSSVVHFLPWQSLIFDITPHSVQPPLRPSFLLPPLYFHSRRPPSESFLHSALVASQTPSFVFIILASFVNLHIHHRIHISVTSNFMCLQCPCVCPSAWFTAADPITVVYTFRTEVWGCSKLSKFPKRNCRTHPAQPPLSILFLETHHWHG